MRDEFGEEIHVRDSIALSPNYPAIWQLIRVLHARVERRKGLVVSRVASGYWLGP